jgi:hypothetical protein
MPSRVKKTLTAKIHKRWEVKPIRTQKKVRNISRSAESKILLRKQLQPDGSPNLDTVPQSALNLLAMGMTSVAFKLSFDTGSIILKRSKIKDPKLELGNTTDTALKRELAFYKMIDGLHILEQQFLARCYDWRVYDKCFFAGRGLMAAEALKPANEPGVCLDMLLEYKGPSLADWLNDKYLEKPNARSSEKSGMLGGSFAGGGLIGGARFKPKEPYRLLYSIFWQLAVIFKILGKRGWQHVDAHPHNITVVNGLTFEGGRRIDYSPLKVSVPTDLLPTEVVYRLEQPPAPNIIPVSSLLPTQGIQIALIDYNLVRHRDFPKAEYSFAQPGTSLIGAEGEAARDMELKWRIFALVFGEHKMMAEGRRRGFLIRHYWNMLMANNRVRTKYPEEWQQTLTKLVSDPNRQMLGYQDYFENRPAYAGTDINEARAQMPENFKYKMLYMRIENELFWLWQLGHAAEICQEYGFDTIYQPLLPKERVIELFFGENTRSLDDIIIWCCEKLGVRPIMNSKRLSQSQKNEPE